MQYLQSNGTIAFDPNNSHFTKNRGRGLGSRYKRGQSSHLLSIFEKLFTYLENKNQHESGAGHPGCILFR